MKYEELGDEIKNLVIDTLKTKEISLEGGWCTPDVFSHMQKLVLENTELKKENQELKELQKQAHEILLQIFRRGYANEVHVDRYFDNAEAIMEALLNKEIK